MQDYCKIRINFAGGVVSPGDLKEILIAAKKANIPEVGLSLRQQLILHLPHQLAPMFETHISSHGIDFQIDSNKKPNLISSYVGEEVFQKGEWITGGIYKDVLDSFNYNPSLKINISDNAQSFTPFFSGHLNFVTSQTPNFWHLFLRKPKTNLVFSCPILIFTNEIAKICKTFEDILAYNPNLSPEELFDKMPKIIFISKDEELKLPLFNLPYYEGLNRYGEKSWLGIYRRNEKFSVPFLLEMVELCLNTKLGELCFTPWKSIIIKDIEEMDRSKWSTLLAKYNINVRHAANELNWQVEDDSPMALQLKNDLASAFNEQDIRTYGICFGIKTLAKTEVFASIMVQRRRFKLFNFIPFFIVFDISYTEDFDPNGRTKVYFAKGVQKLNLIEQLRRSVVFYNQQLAENRIKKFKDQIKPTETKVVQKKRVHQCKTCFSIYDQYFGDELGGIPAGIIFENLPENYICGVCEEPKAKFRLIEIEA